jgi:DNA-binding IclR family transcriptional regulator
MSSVQSIERAFHVLRAMADGPAGVTEIAERIHLPKSTVSRLLSTLETIGAVEQVSAGGRYRIGPAMVELATGTLPSTLLLTATRPHLVALTREIGEASGLSVAANLEVQYIDQVESPNAVQVRDWTGERAPLHVVPSGLVFLANSSPTQIDTYLSRPLAACTPRSMTDSAALRARLGQVRRTNVAWVYEEFLEGMNSVAAPIRDHTGAVIAAIHAHGPAYRFPGPGQADALAERVTHAADQVTRRLTQSQAIAS